MSKNFIIIIYFAFLNKENFLIQLRDGHLNSVFGLNHVDLSKKRGGGGGGGGFVHQNVFFSFSLCVKIKN